MVFVWFRLRALLKSREGAVRRIGGRGWGKPLHLSWIRNSGTPSNSMSQRLFMQNPTCLKVTKVAPHTDRWYNMCMHINRKSESVNGFIDSIAEMDERELDRLQAAIDRRRGSLKKKLSTVLERHEYRNGLLQLEGRSYKRKKDGELTERGPYWYFHYREGGKQRTLYIGKTDNP